MPAFQTQPTLNSSSSPKKNDTNQTAIIINEVEMGPGWSSCAPSSSTSITKQNQLQRLRAPNTSSTTPLYSFSKDQLVSNEDDQIRAKDRRVSSTMRPQARRQGSSSNLTSGNHYEEDEVDELGGGPSEYYPSQRSDGRPGSVSHTIAAVVSDDWSTTDNRQCSGTLAAINTRKQLSSCDR